MNQAFSKIWVAIVLLALVTGGVFAWQYYEGVKSSVLTLEQIKNAKYGFGLERSIQLVNGEYENLDEKISAHIYNDGIAFGDLNSDGKRDAAVITTINEGGSGDFRALAILENKGGKPVYLTSQSLGDRIIINSITIESGLITLDMTVHDLSDAACCPTLKKAATYKLAGTDLIEIPDGTANWKTYANTDYNFSLKYPKQFTIEVERILDKNMGDPSDGNLGLIRLVFNIAEEGVQKYSYYSIDLYASSNKTLAEQFPNESLEPLSDNHGADEAAGDSFKSSQPGSINENFTQQFFRVKNTFFVILPGLQEFTATDPIWNYPVLETLSFTK